MRIRPQIAGDAVRVLLTASGSRGDIEPMLGLAVWLCEFGAHARVCAPPDFASRCADLGLPLEPLAQPKTGSRTELSRYLINWPAIQFGALSTAAAGCDVVVATGVTQFAARSVAEKLGIHYQYVSYQPTTLPSPHHPPMPLPGDRPAPEGIGNQLLWEIDTHGWNAEFGHALNSGRAALGLPPVADVRDHVITDSP